jgi:uncharacterized protein YjbJ (UPF0337 family)
MNTTKAEGVLDQAKGKVKQAVGEAFNNQKLANEGAADQVKGHAKEAWGNVKDAAQGVADRHAAEAKVHGESTAHDLRTNITNAAANAKESINRGIDRMKHDK